MSFFRILCFFILFEAALACNQDEASGAGAPPELTRIRVLLVIDTNSTLRESVENDREDLKRILKEAIPASRLSLVVLDGDHVTRKEILNYFRTLKTNADEALLFYYAGHGAIDPQKGRFFVLQNVKKGKVDPVFRSEIRKAMIEKGAGLTVMLSDCCSERLRVGSLRQRDIAPIHLPAIHCLFFMHRGIVDITAAEDNTSAWGDENGGVFTRAFLNAMNPINFPKLDANHDAFVSWKEFFPVLRNSTEKTFQNFARQARSSGKIVDQSAQKPRAISLAEPMDIPEEPQHGPSESQAVFQLVNAYGKALKYRYRLEGGSDWKMGTLENGAKIQHFLPLSGEVQSAKIELEAEAGDDRLSSSIEAAIWKGNGSPSSEVGKVFRISRK